MADQRREPEQRPSPEALLAELKREEKGEVGRLKIFLGAAAGVGKTYEMLLSARAKRKLGIDVRVVETHGRKKTEVPLRRRDRTASWLGPCTVSSAHEKACEQTAMRSQHRGQRALSGRRSPNMSLRMRCQTTICVPISTTRSEGIRK